MDSVNQMKREMNVGDVKFDTITGVILCGGAGKRIGKEKALLRLAGKSFLERLCNAQKGLFPMVMCAGGNKDFSSFEGLLHIADTPGMRGPLAGLHSALLRAHTEFVFVVPVDMPFLNKDIIIEICSHSCSHAGLVIHHEQKVHPLCGIFHKRTAKNIEALFQSEGQSEPERYPPVMRLLEITAPYIFDFPSDPSWGEFNPFLNINTIEDYELAARYAQEEK